MFAVVANCNDWDRPKLISIYDDPNVAKDVAEKINSTTHITAWVENRPRNLVIGPVVDIFQRKVVKPTNGEAHVYDEREWSYKTIESLEEGIWSDKIQPCGYCKDGTLFMLWGHSIEELDTLMKEIK